MKNCNEYFNIHPTENSAAFILFIKNNLLISIITRIRQDFLNSADLLQEVLNEYSGLIDIMTEEDPGYR